VVWALRLHGEPGGPTSIAGAADLHERSFRPLSSAFGTHYAVDLSQRLNHADQATIIVTVYEPDLTLWETDFRTRRKDHPRV
jgi:hypothetical protein